MIQNIEIKRLYPHPHNPRRELGDLAELAESIKAQGVLQNLTVVPWNFAADKKDWEDDYERFVVLIGHRRLAAAKLAGLSELPCAVVEMDEQTQIATMLLENMQRADLTIYEQAEGIQMMLDLGPSVKEISELTGFSETTVRRRVKLLELDRDKLKKTVERGATLYDLEKLNKIASVELRNAVLEHIGTNNFEYQLKRAMDQEKEAANREKILASLRLWAEETQPDGLAHENRRYYRSFYYSAKPSADDLAAPEDASTVKYLFTENSYNITVYQERETTPEELAEAEKRKEIDQKRDLIRAIAKTAHSCRKDFIKNYAGSKKHTASIIGFAVKSFAAAWSSFNGEHFAKMLGVEHNRMDGIPDDQLADVLQKSPEKTLLLAAYSNLHDGEGQTHLDYSGLSYKPISNLDIIYEVLNAIGYSMSDEEHAWHEGTHELFQEY